jgi:hypothetical protein
MRKTHFLTLTAVLLISFFLTQCKKDNTIYNVYFYTSKDTTEVRLSLFIDDKYKGEIPYLSQKPTYDNDSLKHLAFSLTLSSGKYNMTAKDASGNVKSEQIVKFKNNSSSVRGKSGGSEITGKDNCMIVGFFY